MPSFWFLMVACIAALGVGALGAWLASNIAESVCCMQQRRRPEEKPVEQTAPARQFKPLPRPPIPTRPTSSSPYR